MPLPNPKQNKDGQQHKVTQKICTARQEEDVRGDDATLELFDPDNDNESWESLDLDDADEDAPTYCKPKVCGKSDGDNVGGADAGAVRADRWFASLPPPQIENRNSLQNMKKLRFA